MGRSDAQAKLIVQVEYCIVEWKKRKCYVLADCKTIYHCKDVNIYTSWKIDKLYDTPEVTRFFRTFDFSVWLEKPSSSVVGVVVEAKPVVKVEYCIVA